MRGRPDVGALAARSDRRVTVLVWHYHDNDLPGPRADLTIDVTGMPQGTPVVKRTLIDTSHSNAYTAWLAMGSPQSPTPAQLQELETTCGLQTATDPTDLGIEANHCSIRFHLERQGVSLIELEWPAP